MSAKAAAAAQTLAKGQKKEVTKTRNFTKFGKNAAQVVPRRPAFEHKAVKPVSLKRNDYKIIRGPVTSDKSTVKIENENTMTFWVDIKATKTEIAAAFNRLYKVKPVKVCTVITSKFIKKAYIRLPANVEAMNIATEIGFA
ncbi:ribosomal protein L23, putative [Trichomonas vaginalis G3]|uniref:Ribosomal protein L23, putative n=1 Tax=Trichomonas vaginalis (strain ATCC PRA-98 / G3) TaxID=412133 RepID=A2DBI3_TRIV3|nr:rRNA binding [Trichomonas vaginalis G3]EAY22186.1 ribosomal protein L23, putative [Trichomonas vaginalis G3]KAI5533356.1 rRNA binding [Trichomonas vaginalis G3]|eukprot:XP_001583172.1 ribosomal protein L23 [Trichomonas vaginalis G3]